MRAQSNTSLDSYGRSIANILLIVAGLFLLAMMGITTIDVVGRYIFSRSLAGGRLNWSASRWRFPSRCRCQR